MRERETVESINKAEIWFFGKAMKADKTPMRCIGKDSADRSQQR